MSAYNSDAVWNKLYLLDLYDGKSGRPSRVDIAYTTTEDEQHEIQVSLHFIGEAAVIKYYIDGKIYRAEAYYGEDELMKNVLNCFDSWDEVFDCFISDAFCHLPEKVGIEND